MTSVTVITGIIILLAALVCYAFVSQTISQKKEQRKRVLAALKSQLRSFKFMISGCPDGFLTKDLKVIVLRSLVEVCEQLSKLEPKEPAHLQELQQHSNLLTEAQRAAPTKTRAQLESLQQIKEVKMSLEELHRFVFKMEGQSRVTRSQADTYRAQIKQLVLQVTVDGYVLSGQQANQNGKTKLALHYFDLAAKLLQREGKSGMFDAKISQLKEVCTQLQQGMTEEDSGEVDTVSEEEKAELEGEWDKFSKDNEDIWKKKQVYD